MNHSGHEGLVILRAAPAVAAVDLLAAYADVTQCISARVAVVSGSRDALARIEALPAVEKLLDGPASPDVLPPLSEVEALFAAAWLSRQGAPRKVRPGDGLDWDAAGRSPPDPPREGD